MTFNNIRNQIRNDKENKKFTDKGWQPILMVNPEAKILIIGQAPGLETQVKKIPFLDQSGKRLRKWLGVTEDEFYKSNNFSVLPLDFYYPGPLNYGDKPPRKDFAKKWHPKLLELMPNIELTILAGAYSQKEYLKDAYKKNLTETVRSYKDYLPEYFPIVHPSPINQRWEKKNPFFKEDVLPNLQKIVFKILNNNQFK